MTWEIKLAVWPKGKMPEHRTMYVNAASKQLAIVTTVMDLDSEGIRSVRVDSVREFWN